MAQRDFSDIFTPEALREMFPQDKADQFFDALYGDASEGAYDISLAYGGASNGQLNFELHLSQRPNKCLACNLTYGLPQVFGRHPVIDLKGLAGKIGQKLGGAATVEGWQLGRTSELSRELHVIPFTVDVRY